MNRAKKSVLVLTAISLISMQQSYTADKAPQSRFFLPPVPNALSNLTIPSILYNPKDLAKVTAWLVNAAGLGYYFFHRPENRPSDAPFEQVLQGRWGNVIGDTFNWENVEHFTDIWPGQRYKIYSYKFDGRSGAKLTITDSDRADIKGFGIYHFCEKNMKKIVKWAAALAISYGLASGRLNAQSFEEASKQLLNIILFAYKSAEEVVGLPKPVK